MGGIGLLRDGRRTDVERVVANGLLNASWLLK